MRVELEWDDGTCYTGEAEGTDTFSGKDPPWSDRLPEGGSTTRRGVHPPGATRRQGGTCFRPVGGVVSLRGRAGEERYQLLGSFAAPDEDVARGAVLSVLDATNRVLGKQG